MRALCKWLICGLLLVARPGIAWSAGQSPLSPTTAVLTSALPDSIRLKMLALLAEGDIPGAIALWQVHTGRTDVPQVLQDLHVAFQVTSRALNSCTHVARTIHAGFRYFGGRPEYVRISSTQGQYLSWQNRAIMSDNNFHVAVRHGGKIFDAFTGSGGMLEKDYLQSLIMAGEPIIKTVVSP
jgi:hypothetical protein